MLGLAVGILAGGRFIASLGEKTGLSARRFYAGGGILDRAGGILRFRNSSRRASTFADLRRDGFLPLSFLYRR